MNSAVYRRSAVALAGGTTGQGTTGDSCGGLACSGCRSHAASVSTIIPHNPADVSINKKNQPQTMTERGSVAETRLKQHVSEELPMINIITNIPSPVNIQPAAGCNNKYLIESMAISEATRSRLNGNTSTVGVPISDTSSALGFQKELVRRLLVARQLNNNLKEQ
ncbi:unnamed protein product [Ceratitis capitata]|uniref:(Mediterranean fruit fly) hypothetical protein n=1 Tax=Ceratitis capitata TaxID=7213 RepID=A0A811UU33_CERCA|nr:unnamed protein product [Ceratitis capitata]